MFTDEQDFHRRLGQAQRQSLDPLGPRYQSDAVVFLVYDSEENTIREAQVHFPLGCEVGNGLMHTIASSKGDPRLPVVTQFYTAPPTTDGSSPLLAETVGASQSNHSQQQLHFQQGGEGITADGPPPQQHYPQYYQQFGVWICVYGLLLIQGMEACNLHLEVTLFITRFQNPARNSREICLLKTSKKLTCLHLLFSHHSSSPIAIFQLCSWASRQPITSGHLGRRATLLTSCCFRCQFFKPYEQCTTLTGCSTLMTLSVFVRRVSRRMRSRC